MRGDGKPIKQQLLSEVHVFLVIAAGLALRADLSNEVVTAAWYDWGLFISFLVLVPGGFVAAVVSKVWSIRRNLSEESLNASFTRLCTGLASDADREHVLRRVKAIQAALDPAQRKRLGEALHIASAGADYERVVALLEEGADASYVQHSGITPLHRAVQSEDVEMTEALFSRACSPSERA